MAATDGEEFVELPTGTLVARCDACGVVTDDEIEQTATVGVRQCGYCGGDLPTVTSLSKPLEVSADAFA